MRKILKNKEKIIHCISIFSSTFKFCLFLPAVLGLRFSLLRMLGNLSSVETNGRLAAYKNEEGINKYVVC